MNSLPQETWRISLLIACGLALWRGRTPERIAALACALASFAQPFVIDPRNWLDPQWGVLLVDCALLGVLVTLAVTTDRTWLLFASAFQLLSVVIHLAMLVDHGVQPLPYRRGLVIWSYLILAALAVGSWSRRPPEPAAP